MSDNTLVAIIAICVTAVIVARIWASTKHRYPRR